MKIWKWGTGMGLLFLMATPAWAGWVLSLSSPLKEGTTDEKKIPSKQEQKPREAQLFIEGGKLKLAIQAENPVYFILDLDGEKLIAAFSAPPMKNMFSSDSSEDEEGRKTVKAVEMTPEKKKTALVATVDELLKTLDEFITSMVQMMESMQKRMEQMMKNLPPEQREKMKSPQTPSSKETAEEKEPVITVKPIGKTKTIAGCTTQGFEIYWDKQKQSEVWTCPDVNLDYLLPKFEKIGQKFDAFAKKWQDKFPSIMPGGQPASKIEKVEVKENLELWKQMKGLPFEVNTTEDGKTFFTVFQVTQYQSSTIPASEFDVPPGYTVIPLKDFLQSMMMLGGMMQGMGGMMGGGAGGHSPH